MCMHTDELKTAKSDKTKIQIDINWLSLRAQRVNSPIFSFWQY